MGRAQGWGARGMGGGCELVVGGAALAGIPPLGGFFSKEEIFAALGHDGVTLYWVVALLAAFLTAYYTFRMIFLVTRPQQVEVMDAHGDHGRAEPLSMALPVALLTVGAAVAGFWGGDIARGLGIEAGHHSLAAMAPALAVVALGVLVAWLDFGRQSAARTGFIARMPARMASGSFGQASTTAARDTSSK